MERMNEIMKDRVEADKSISISKEAYKNHIDRLDKKMATAGPIKIGDIVEANGFSYRGKKMIVDMIWIINDCWKSGIKAKGRVLKKDGTPGLNTADYFIEVAVAP